MTFNNALTNFAKQVPVKKLSCATEEATKHSLILPVIQLMGYDIFDPTEVVPEVDCDLKQAGERIDYIIERNGIHQLLIECKYWKQNLDRHVTQLRAYFAASDAKLSILTNGIEYRFYTDLEKTNLMDDEPFLVVDMEHIDEDALAWLGLFRKEVFDVLAISDKALRHKRMNKLRQLVADELASPSADIVKHFAKLLYGTTPNQKVIGQLRPMLIQAINEHIGVANTSMPATRDATPIDVVQDILKDIVQPQRVIWKDNLQYSTVRLDGQEWSPICRVKFTQWAKWITITHWDEDSDKMSQGEKHTIETPADIRNHADEIRHIVTQMLTWASHKDTPIK